MVVDEGDGDGEVQVVDPPNDPPLPQWLLKALGPLSATARKAGPIPWSAQVLQEGCAGDQPVSPRPPNSHMTVMWIFRRLIRCLIRRNKGNTEAPGVRMPPGGGSGSGNPSLVPPLPPCHRQSVRAPCPH